LELQAYNVAHSAIIPPYNFWNTEFRNKQPAFIRLNLTLPWGANFAVYGRRNVAPSVTQYDFAEFVKGGRVVHRLKRDVAGSEAVSFMRSGRAAVREHVASSSMLSYQHVLVKRSIVEPLMVNVSLLQYFDTGDWFLSVYNDELQSYKVTLVITEAEGVSTTCPNDCSGRGSCYLGKCDCIDGYQVRERATSAWLARARGSLGARGARTICEVDACFQGADCSKSVCPVLCSSHGQYGGGMCHCEEGWKGAECDIPLGDCQVPDCNQHGQCDRGSCVCNPGWKGAFCDERKSKWRDGCCRFVASIGKSALHALLRVKGDRRSPDESGFYPARRRPGKRRGDGSGLASPPRSLNLRSRRDASRRLSRNLPLAGTFTSRASIPGPRVLFLHVRRGTINFSVIQARAPPSPPRLSREIQDISNAEAGRRRTQAVPCARSIINARGVREIYMWVKPRRFGATISFILFRGNSPE
jgi:hypothetical protein